MRKPVIFGIGLIAGLMQGIAGGQPLCHNSGWETPAPQTVWGAALFNTSGEQSDFNVDIEADYAEVTRQGAALSGQVQLQRGKQQLRANQAYYSDVQQVVDLEGQVHYRDMDFDINAVRAAWQLALREGWLHQADYRLLRYQARGKASVVHWIEQQSALLAQVTYTACPEGDESWYLSARQLQIDQVESVGEAQAAKLYFKGVPILYTPYLRFPLDQRRRSGWLAPDIALTEETGFDIQVPYYLNIAPEQDATITPRLLTRRGLMLGMEYRYLLAGAQGKLFSELLAKDMVTGEGRGQFNWQQALRLTPQWGLDWDIHYVSDSDYFADFGNELNLSSATHLERRLRTRWDGEFWFASAMLQGFQTLDQSLASEQHPYQRLPQLLFKLKRPGNFGLVYDLQAEWAYFERDDSITGSRLDLWPRLEWPHRTAASFIVPALSMRYTRYDLNNIDLDTADGIHEATPDRMISSFSLDSGLFFERDWQWGGQALLQTLEPRLFYLYIPYQSQTELPVLDAGELDFSFAQLFQENRFAGVDRVGDANQVALALSSRILSADTGVERLRASMGQIWHFTEPKVVLPGQVPSEGHLSAWVAELNGYLMQYWSARGTWQWDPDQTQTDKAVIHLHYQSDRQRIINIAYRFRRDELEQTDLSWRWPLNRQWSMVGRWNYSLLDQQSLEVFGGFERESCCWATRLVLREQVNDAQGAQNLALYFELELKGLSRISNNINQLLESGIPGYRRNH